MWYVYLLKSSKNGDIYVGFSNDLRARYKRHNGGYVRATKPNRPWKLIYYEAYCSKDDATGREKQLKDNHKAKKDLNIQLKNSLEL